MIGPGTAGGGSRASRAKGPGRESRLVAERDSAGRDPSGRGPAGREPAETVIRSGVPAAGGLAAGWFTGGPDRGLCRRGSDSGRR